MKRILSMLLCLALVIGFIPVFTMPAQAAGDTFVKVTEAPSDWGGTYLIVYEAGSLAFNGSMTTLDATKKGASVTITNGTIEANDTTKSYAFTITKSGTNYLIKSSSGYYIGQTSNANGLKSSQTTTYENTLSINDDGSVNILSSGGAYLRFNASSNEMRFRYFKSSTYTGQKAICLYKLVEDTSGGETPSCDHADSKLSWDNDETQHWQECECGDYTTTPVDHDFSTSDTCECGYEKPTVSDVPPYKLVTDASTLKAGDKIVIVAAEYDVALSTEQKSNNRGQAAVTKDGNTVTFGEDVQILELREGKTTDTFAFYAENGENTGYLYAASSSGNYLRTETELSDNSSWTIAIATGGTATIVAQGENTRNTMQYNENSSLFATYSSASQEAICIYKLLPKVEKTNTRFGQTQSLLFAYKAADLGSTTDLVAKITKADGTPIELTNWTTETIENEDYYVIEVTGITGKEMTDEFTIVIMNGEEAVTQTETMSLRDYAMSVLKECGDEDAEYRTLIVDMLNYGAAAQTKFGYNTEDLANSELDATQQGYASDSIAAISGERTVSNTEVFGGTNLRFNDKINMLFRFEISLDTYAEITWNNHKVEPQTVTVSSDKYAKDGTYYVVELAGLVVADGRQEVTCTIKNTSDNSVVAEVTDSVMWNYSRLDDSDEYKALYEAFMMYADSAYAYMH